MTSSKVTDFQTLPRHRNNNLNRVHGRDVDTAKLYFTVIFEIKLNNFLDHFHLEMTLEMV